MVYKAGDGHPGPALSIADIIAALYFHVMSIDPRKPDWEDRDRFVLSKGHACTALYAALARRGYFSIDEYGTLRSLHSILQGHPCMRKTPGVDATTGSLGNGISVGLGMAMAGRLSGKKYSVFVIVGDGEIQEGVIWEGIRSAAHLKAGNLIVFLDNNGWQSGGRVEEVGGLPSMEAIWSAFGWHCQAIDGHDIAQIVEAVEKAKSIGDKPSLIVCKTVKGKGVPFMENNNDWHKKVPTKAEWEQAMACLGRS